MSVDHFEQVVRQRTCPRIGPLEVFEDEHHRFRLGERLDPGATGVSEIAREILTRRPFPPAQFAREKRLQMMKHFGVVGAEKRLELDAKPGPNCECSFSFLNSQPIPQGFDDRREENSLP